MYNKLNPYGYCIQEDTTNLTRLVFVEILKKNSFNLSSIVDARKLRAVLKWQLIKVNSFCRLKKKTEISLRLSMSFLKKKL